MKRLSVITGLISIGILLVNPITAKDLKIGYIDSDRILNESQDYKDAKRVIDEEEREYSKQARDMEQDIKNLEDEIEAQSLMWSEEKKIEKQQQGQQLVVQYQQFLQEIWGQTGKLYQRNLELSKPIVDKINAAITKIGEEEEYDFIFDASSGNIVFADPDFDLTDRVLEELSKK